MAKAATKGVLTPQSEDFPRWYQEVVAKAELAESGAVRGTMIIKPWGYAIWERVQAELDRRIKATGHENVYFPLFIPYGFLQREGQHVEGFSPELAVVTTAGGEELAEPLVVRPTSETVIGDAMARWIQGYRDLPLLLNQWANVVRWELRPRVFLRTTEFLWQEGHTAHATSAEAVRETLMILHDVYDDVVRNVLAIPSVLGRKTTAERFAGARTTYTLEALMRDGKALQMGTSHDLGQNFARAFGIEFTDGNGERQHAWTTSWGVSTRTVGGLIMAHGDDRGLRLPPALAPVQVVVLAIKEEAVEAAERLTGALEHAGVRARLDANTSQSFGRRAVDWELKGVPIRLEIGPRDLAEGHVTRVRRDRGAKEPVPLDGVVRDVTVALDEIQRGLHDEALAFREGHTRDADSGEEVDGAGFWRVPWDKVGEDGEAALAERGYSVRCLTDHDGTPPAPEEGSGLIAWISRAY
ncbi:MAG: proline--tRNA ligase [Nitriliruptorales bacterium]|nr:proline--tRNA ligase [Nitriliruptorales bacterium]